jgi:hypothetical protein
MGLRHIEQTKAGVDVISQILYHVEEGVDYRGSCSSRLALLQRSTCPWRAAVRVNQYGQGYRFVMARASALASALLSSGMRMP